MERQQQEQYQIMDDYVKYTAPVNGELAINTKIGKGKTFYIVAEDGTKAAEGEKFHRCKYI